jgi:hypothetical protein
MNEILMQWLAAGCGGLVVGLVFWAMGRILESKRPE